MRSLLLAVACLATPAFAGPLSAGAITGPEAFASNMCSANQIVKKSAAGGTQWQCDTDAMGGGGAGASTADDFVTIGHGSADLTAERALTGDASITITDGGANNAVTVSRAALTGDISASAGLNATTLGLNVVTDAKLRQSTGTTVIGHAAAGTSNVADITANNDGDILRRVAGALGFGAIAESSVTNLTTDLAAKAQVAEGTVDFGATGSFDASVAIASTWVTATSKIVCSPTLLATADRPDGSDDALLEQLTTAIYARSNGVGFTVKAHAPSRAFGKFLIQCAGA